MKPLPKKSTERFNRFDERRADRMVQVFNRYIFKLTPDQEKAVRAFWGRVDENGKGPVSL